MEELVGLVNQVGFPILAYLLMYGNNVKLGESIGNLNVTLKELVVRMEALEEKEGLKNGKE